MPNSQHTITTTQPLASLEDIQEWARGLMALRQLAQRLDRLIARLAFWAIAASACLFAFHGLRFAARIWGLS